MDDGGVCSFTLALEDGGLRRMTDEELDEAMIASPEPLVNNPEFHGDNMDILFMELPSS